MDTSDIVYERKWPTKTEEEFKKQHPEGFALNGILCKTLKEFNIQYKKIEDRAAAAKYKYKKECSTEETTEESDEDVQRLIISF
jgi:hypothetical protein